MVKPMGACVVSINVDFPGAAITRITMSHISKPMVVFIWMHFPWGNCKYSNEVPLFWYFFGYFVYFWTCRLHTPVAHKVYVKVDFPSAAITRITMSHISKPVPGMFVLIWMHSSWWFQIQSPNFLKISRLPPRGWVLRTSRTRLISHALQSLASHNVSYGVVTQVTAGLSK